MRQFCQTLFYNSFTSTDDAKLFLMKAYVEIMLFSFLIKNPFTAIMYMIIKVLRHLEKPF